LALVLVGVGAASAWGQNAISAHSGMIHYVEGTVLLDGQAVEPKFAEFPEVKNNQTLATEEGRVEVLLTPGVFLRLSEDSSFRMLSNRLSDTALEVLSGSALVEVDELLKDNAIAVKFKGASTALAKKGLYKFDAEKGVLRVYDGEASVTAGQQTIVARKGKEIACGETLVASNFDPKDTDPFFRWASRRADYIATANVSAARSAGTLGLLSSSGSWAWSPYYGMFTYLPGYGYGYSPFGYAFYSPLTVGNFYSYYNNYGSGYYGGGGTPQRAGSYTTTSTGAAALAPQRNSSFDMSSSSASSAGVSASSGSPAMATGTAGGISSGSSGGASMSHGASVGGSRGR